MKYQSLWIALSVLSVAACQPQTAVEAPVASEATSSSVAVPVEAPVAASATSVAAAPASESGAAVKQNTAAAVPTAPKPARAPVAAEPAIESAAPVAVKAVEKRAPALSEADALALAKKNGCLACHAIDKKVFGPAWRDVANKYRGDAGAEARLAEKIAKGGSGVWGNTPMPAHPKVTETERQALARFVLSLK
jgi:cytochrome c